MALILWSCADNRALSAVSSPILGSPDSRVEHSVVPSMDSLPPHNVGDVILAFGAKALALLESSGITPKKRTITSLREKIFQVDQASLLVTFDPSIVSRDYTKLPEIQWDIRLASRLARTGSVRPGIGEYRYVESLHELIEYIDTQYADTGRAVEVACDLETKGLDEYNPDAWIIACSFTVEPGKSDVLYFDKGEAIAPPAPWSSEDEWSYWEGLWVQVNWLLTTEKVSLRGANFKFDSRWLVHKWGISCTNQKFDTMLVGSLLDENRSNSLKLHAKIYTQMGGYEDDMDKYDFAHLDKVPKFELLNYCGGDTAVTYQVATVEKKELLKDKALTNFYVRVVQPSVKVFEQLERNGVYVDLPYYEELKGELESEISRLSEAMVQYLPNALRSKHKDSLSTAIAEGKNPLKASILTEFMFTPMGLNLKPRVFTEKTKAPSTAMDHLLMFSDDPRATNFIDLLKEHGSASKTLSTYVVGFLKHLRSDGKFHPAYFLAAGNYAETSNDGGTNCLVASSLLLTRKGWSRVVDVAVGDEVLTYAGAWKPVTGLVDNGVKKVYAVTTKQGHAVKCTDNHKFYTPTGWVRTHDLAAGARVYSYGGVEVWMPVAGFPLYEVSSWGRVRNSETSRIVKDSAKGDWGHRKVTLVRGDRLRKSGNRKDFPVHRLVASHFVQNNEEMPEVRHLDGVAGNNCVWNLAWGTSEDTYSYKWGVDTVLSVEFIGEFPTYDATVEGDHSYVVNGLVTHNTGRTSASNPAWQCLIGSSLVFTDRGQVPIAELVSQYENGKVFRVLTHTGKWRRVVGVYRNGVQNVFSVSSERGTLTSTANHPYLTQRGWVRADQLTTEDSCYAIKRIGDAAQDAGLYQSNLSQLGSYEESLQQSNQQGLEAVRGERDNPLSPVARLQELSGGHGGEALQGVVCGAFERKRELRAGELCLGNPQNPAIQSEKHQAIDSQRGYEDRSSVGHRLRDFSWQAALPVIKGGAYGNSPDEGEGVHCGVFQEFQIVSIVPAGQAETFDITIDGSHSFVANGFVVHNTLPKHTKWAKKLRRAFVAPPGYTLLEVDFSQGELRIAAVVAEEPTMLKAYIDGLDLHAITAAAMNGYTLEDFMLLPKPTMRELRSSGKAGNFGLLYGMQAAGFQQFAWVSYGVKMTLDEAIERRNGFFQRYPRLPEWHDEYKALAHAQGFIRSPLGRIRHLPLINSKDREMVAQAERNAINSPIQSTLSDMMQLAMVYIERQYGHDVIQMFAMTHDSIHLRVPEDDAVLWAKRIIEIMENLPLKEVFGWNPPLKFKVDGSIAVPDEQGVTSLANMVELTDL